MINCAKAIYFDMDGTIADLYGVQNWLEALRHYQVFPYLSAEPMWDMEELVNLLRCLRKKGYTIGIISWLSKESNREYNNEVRKAKNHWLECHGIKQYVDEIHITKYGTPKHTTAKIRKGILIDDNEGVRANWEKYGGMAVNPLAVNICNFLEELCDD